MAALSVILAILRIAGIVLLVVLGIVLLLVLIVLFCPVCYSLNADIDDSDAGIKERARAHGRVTWLFHFIRIYFDYPPGDDGILSIKIAFFRLYPQKKTGRRGSKEADNASNSSTEFSDETKYLEKEERTDEKATDAGSENTTTPDSAGQDTDRADTETVDFQAADAEKAEKNAKTYKKSSAKERINDIKNRLYKALKKPAIAAKKIYYTISSVCDRISYVRATIQSECFERAKQLLFNEARRVIHHIMPRKTRVRFKFGADDPKITADVTAAAGMLYPLFEERVYLEPVFDEEILAGTVRLAGRVMLVVPVFSALRIFFNRDVRRVYKRFKKLHSKFDREKEAENDRKAD